ncbi:D-sedoheptulose-7-phosphate isomerase [Hippea alviniae]|uniref:D-sedoheptulose-7-phosphate isomerase n=1 Tax=Hippea alviniae TaxID=1279027 RepID=UPI0003B67583|nr:D-sedoheptulose 7-phosphate isomerase [Hippea alviniae]
MKKEEFLQAVEELEKALKHVSFEEIKTVADEIIDAFKKGHTLFICGNGGSAADAQHMAAEFVNRFLKEREPLPAIALTTDTSNITSIANDYSFDNVFEKQLKALSKSGDILIGISTSGNSKNIVRAFETAREIGVKTVGLLGRDGGVLRNISDYAIVVKSHSTPRIQEVHTFIIHAICQMVEDAFA